MDTPNVAEARVREPRKRRFERRSVVAGGIVAAILGYAGAWAANALADASDDSGATSAALEEAYSTLLGAMGGLAVGAAVAVACARGGSALTAGLAAALLGYVCLAPGLWLISDTKGAGDTLVVLLIALPYILAAALAGAAAGLLVRRLGGR